jgi:acetylornithine deacetylase
MATDRCIELLKKLVAISSVNPSLVQGAQGEAAIAGFVEAELKSIGMDTQTIEVVHGRPNVIGSLRGRSKGRALILCGHLDTVGMNDESLLTPVEKDGRVYGRGTVDMKAGVAAMIDAARRVKETGGLSAGELIIAAVMDEEYTSLGAESLVKSIKADAAIVTEQTDLSIGIAHKGFTWVEIETRGIAAHGSKPLEGRDAIFRMGRVLRRLEQLDHELQSRQPHPLLGPPSLHASLISGGSELSTYPDQCSLKIERRTVSSDPKGAALHEVLDILERLRMEDPDLICSATMLFDRLPYETPQDSALPRLLESAIKKFGRPAERRGMSYWADAAILGHAGIPTVLFGPGGEGAHSPDEYVKIDDVIVCRDILAECARSFCSLGT